MPASSLAGTASEWRWRGVAYLCVRLCRAPVYDYDARHDSADAVDFAFDLTIAFTVCDFM